MASEADRRRPAEGQHLSSPRGLDATTLAPSFSASALAAPDAWLVEAYESPDHGWVYGVQWHPERIFELPEGHRRLWESFLTACRARAGRLFATS
ncbi:MAG: C26 family cysteine hydrolase domain-containing family [Caldilineaceae bacterium]|nr:C26 family cysteine hydrolase domain-containing family [Caldilineaceae bacterium]